MFTTLKYRRRLLQSWRLFTDWVPRGKLWLLTQFCSCRHHAASHCIVLIRYHQYHQWQDLTQCEPRQAQIKRETALLSPDHMNCSQRTLPSTPPSVILAEFHFMLSLVDILVARLCVQQVLMMVIKTWLRITIKTTFMVFIFLWFAS